MPRSSFVLETPREDQRARFTDEVKGARDDYRGGVGLREELPERGFEALARARVRPRRGGAPGELPGGGGAGGGRGHEAHARRGGKEDRRDRLHVLVRHRAEDERGPPLQSAVAEKARERLGARRVVAAVQEEGAAARRPLLEPSGPPGGGDSEWDRVAEVRPHDLEELRRARGERDVPRLVLAGERGRERVSPLRGLEREPGPVDRRRQIGDRELPRGFVQDRARFAGGFAERGGRFVLDPADESGPAPAENPRLLPGDGRDGRPELLDVVETDRRDDREESGRDVRRVEAAAEPDLEDGEVEPARRERDESGRRQGLEVGRRNLRSGVRGPEHRL